MIAHGLPDTPEGRAVAQIAAALADRAEPGQLASARNLARIALLAMIELGGPESAAQYFAGLSRDALSRRGSGRGTKRA